MKKVIAGLFIAGMVAVGCLKAMDRGRCTVISYTTYKGGNGCNAASSAAKPAGDSSPDLPVNLPPVHKIQHLPVVIDYTENGGFQESGKASADGIIRINNIYQ